MLQCLARVTDAVNHSPPTAQGGIHPHILLAPSTFTDTTPLSRPSVKRVHRGWEPHPHCWMRLPEQPDCGMLQWRQCHTCATEHLLLSMAAHKQPAGTERSGSLRQGPCLPSELASCRSVEPQEQRYCLIVLINTVTRC